MSPFSNPQLNSREGHQRFVELCALQGSGSLQRDEIAELNEHLENCEGCKALVVDYRALVRLTVPLLADDSALEPARGFHRELARTKRKLLSSLPPSESAIEDRTPLQTDRLRGMGDFFGFRSRKYAVLIMLGACIGVAGYEIGIREVNRSLQRQIGQDQGKTLLLTELADAARKRDSLKRMIERQQQKIDKAAGEAAQEAVDITKVRQLLSESLAGKSQDAAAIANLNNENALLKADRDGLARRLQEDQLTLALLREDLDQLQDAGSIAESAAAEKRVEELSAQVSEQQRLLVADKDIRELMGARDLLISDVIDVDTKGHNKTPFGRIFYTKNQRLVFYAFDLDKQPGIRSASTFQAWGARATSRGNESPVSMGVFYMDNVMARRWVLKLDDRKVLGQIDSVFVTLEPEGGSSKPSGRQFLFTYLRGEANHP